jgi:hypothetical protein
MPKTPDFHRIAATITDGDIDAFFRSAAPDDFKQQVREAPDHATKQRFVAGYLIRTQQIKPDRLKPKVKKIAVEENCYEKSVCKETSEHQRRRLATPSSWW